jgi:dienelactone hydrolase
MAMRTMLAAVIAVLTAVLMLLGAPASATTEDQLTLPAPTGRHQVGMTDLHLVDQDRPDPWVPTGPRELMVSVWYPTAAGHGERVPYTTPEESALLLAGTPGVPADALTRVRTHSRLDAPPTRRRLPLVVLSPGLGLPRLTLTTLAEDLASRGYVVAAVDHTYEAAAITFPDGRIAECVVCAGEWTAQEITASRTVDIEFVLDDLLGRYATLIDARRIAAGGHSIGGAAAATTMLADPRVDAGFDLDGSFQPGLTTDLSRPFLMVGAGPHGLPGTDPSWDETWTHLTGWARWLHVPEMEHASPTDLPVLRDLLGLPSQSLSGTRSVEITRAYVNSFVDQHLRHRPRPLLDGPSPRFPEVDFVQNL